MTSRTTNWKKRIKIPNNCVNASLVQMGGYSDLDCQIDFSNIPYLVELPSDASVFVDATFRGSFMRLDYGKVSSLCPPVNTALRDLDSMTVAKIVVLVVEKGEILAASNQFTLTNQNAHSAGSKSIIKIEYRNLDERPWKLEIYSDNTMPVIVMDKKWVKTLEAGGIQIDEDLQIIAPMMPQILQTILERILLIERCSAYELFDGDDGWRHDWIIFAHSEYEGVLPATFDQDDSDIYSSVAIDWIDAVVTNYCNKRGLKSRLVNLYEGGM